jgi:hypothetical protein
VRRIGPSGDDVDGVGMVLIIVALAVLAACGLMASRRGAAGAGEEPVLLPVID